MQVKDKIMKIMIEHLKLNPDKINPEARFIQDLGISSMTLWEMLMVMEDEFNIEVPEEDVRKIRTIRGAIEYIEGRVGTTTAD
jgi:acyl carrier protein